MSQRNVRTAADSTPQGWVGAASALTSAMDYVEAHAKQLSLLLGVLHALAGAVAALRSLRRERPLSRAPSSRGLGSSIPLLGAAVALGAGVGSLFAPTSGAKLRRRIGRRIDEILGESDRAPLMGAAR
jgi:hypothetical protein